MQRRRKLPQGVGCGGLVAGVLLLALAVSATAEQTSFREALGFAGGIVFGGLVFGVAVRSWLFPIPLDPAALAGQVTADDLRADLRVTPEVSDHWTAADEADLQRTSSELSDRALVRGESRMQLALVPVGVAWLAAMSLWAMSLYDLAETSPAWAIAGLVFLIASVLGLTTALLRRPRALLPRLRREAMRATSRDRLGSSSRPRGR